MLCTVTGTLKDLSGQPLPNATVVFYRSGIAAQDGDTVIPKYVEVISDGSGDISVALYSGEYAAEAVSLNGAPETFSVGVPDQASAVLSDLIDQQPALTPSTLTDTIAARDAAEQHKNDAEGAANQAASDVVASLTASLEGIRDQAEDHADDALTAKNAAETAAGSAGSVVSQDLSPISRAIPAGAVAICEINPWATPGNHKAWMEDASKSWFKEATINTAYLGAFDNETLARADANYADLTWYWNRTDKKCYQLNAGSGQTEKFRFGKAAFVARSAVAYSDRVVLLDEVGVPWMVFYDWSNSQSDMSGIGHGGNISSVRWVGSSLLLGRSDGSWRGLYELNFATGGAEYRSATVRRSRPDMLSGGYETSHSDGWIVDSHVNAVAATVLPNAPVSKDPKRAQFGLPEITIAVATDGGVSVSNGPAGVGTVVDWEDIAFRGVALDEDWLYSAYGSAGRFYVDHLPSEDTNYGSTSYDVARHYRTMSAPAAADDDDLYYLDDGNERQVSSFARVGNATLVLGTEGGLSTILENFTDPASGMIAYHGRDFATPPMFGDVKSAFLTERGAETLVGASLVSGDSSTFASGLGAWGVNGYGGVVSHDVDKLKIEINAKHDGAEILITGLTVGETYIIEADGIAGTYQGTMRLQVSGIGVPSPQLSHASHTMSDGDAPFWIAFTATATSRVVQFMSYTSPSVSGETVFLDNFTVKAASADRSVNGKGAIIDGTITRAADGSHTGWASSILEQPYNPDLDFGSGAFYTHSRVKLTGGANNVVVTRTAKGAGWGGTNHFALTYRSPANQIEFKTHAGQVVAAVDPADGNFHDISTVFDGATLFIYLDGRLVGSGALALDISGVGEPVLAMGRGYYNGSKTDSVAELKGVIIGAGAPSPAQIRIMANWKGDVIEGTIRDLSYVDETKSLWVLTAWNLYEIGPDGAERSKHVNDISATTLAAWNGGRLVS